MKLTVCFWHTAIKIPVLGAAIALLGAGCTGAPGDPGAVSAASTTALTTRASHPTETLPWVRMPVPGNPVLDLPALQGGNGHGLSWDGRLALFSGRVAAPVKASYDWGASNGLLAGLSALSLTSTAARPADRPLTGGYSLRLDTKGHLLLLRGGAVLWTSQILGSDTQPCTPDCRVDFADGKLQFRQGATGAVTYATGGVGTEVRFYSAAPYMAIVDTAQQSVVVQGGGTSTGLILKVIRPELLSATTNPWKTGERADFQAALNSSFSSPFSWATAEDPDLPVSRKDFYAGMYVLPTRGTGHPQIIADQKRAENPYLSDEKGNELSTPGAVRYATYQVYLVITNPGADSIPTSIGMMPAKIIVSNPGSTRAAITDAFATGPYKTMTTVTNQPVQGIEPTLTFDGRLLVLHYRIGAEVGTLRYSYHPQGTLAADPTTGWSDPQRLTQAYLNPELPKRYPFARYPIRDANGAIRGPSQIFDGAYPWISLDGADIFFTAACQLICRDDKPECDQPCSGGAAQRAGTSVVGASTRGMLRLIDGGPNTSRYGTPVRLLMSSLGRMPGMWSPLSLTNNKIFPLTDKLATYPSFLPLVNRYFEVSFEETVAGNYDVYFEMNEAIQVAAFSGQAGTPPNRLDTRFTPDVSGNFHLGRLPVTGTAALPVLSSVLFTDEAYGCKLNDKLCPATDPASPDSKLYSGKALYFTGGGALTVPHASATGHQILQGARAATVSLAVRPLGGAAGQRLKLLDKAGVLDATLLADGKVSLSFTTAASATPVTVVSSRALLRDAWTHVAATFDPDEGALRLFLDGDADAEVALAKPVSALSASTADLLIGPVGSKAGAALLYAIDQVGVSPLVRTGPEILRQANRVAPRTGGIQPGWGVAASAGLARKDVQAETLLKRDPIPARVELGRLLFHDPRLSSGNHTACASCHLPSSAFAEPVALHQNLLAGLPGRPTVLLRNTPSVLNAAFRRAFLHDGRAPRLQEQARMVTENPEEMGSRMEEILPKLRATALYPAKFRDAFEALTAAPGPEMITAERIGEALAEYQLSLVVGGSAFDRFRAGDYAALTPDQRKGLALFYGRARCAECHSTTALTDQDQHRLPFPLTPGDAGRQRTSGHSADRGRFLTPSLRDVARTAPYFHDGSVATLDAAISRYVTAFDGATLPDADDGLTKIDLTADEQRQLRLFLEGLSSAALPAADAPSFGADAAVRATDTVTVPRAKVDLGSLPGSAIELDAAALRVNDRGQLLVQNRAGDVLWSRDTFGACGGGGCDPVLGCTARLQGDGNFVVRNGKAAPNACAWGTGTSGKPATQLVVKRVAPFLQILDSAGTVLWSSGVK